MKSRNLIVAVLLLFVAAIPVMAAEVKAVPPADADGSTAIDGMTCLSDQGFQKPEIGAPDQGQSPQVPKCPTNFSNCPNVPGRACSLQNCVTEDLGYSSCRKPGGHVITCIAGNIQQTTCDCLERLHQICCDDNSCGFTCGECTGGSLTTVCP